MNDSLLQDSQQDSQQDAQLAPEQPRQAPRPPRQPNQRRAEIREFSAMQCTFISLFLLIGFTGFAAIGAVAAKKLSDGDDYSAFAGGIMGFGTFILLMLSLMAPYRPRRNLQPPAQIFISQAHQENQEYRAPALSAVAVLIRVSLIHGDTTAMSLNN
jgi:hypothetical protein